MIFSHGGKYGDLIYALPAIKHLGGGDLVLHPHPGVGMTFTPDNIEAIRPLLESQDYVKSVRYSEHPVGLNLDQYRNHWRHNLNIADILHNWLGIPFASRTEPWLKVDPNRVAPVVMARCPRYRNGNFPWGRVVQKYGKECVFVGHPDEYREFCDLFGHVPYFATKNFLEAARVIAGADLFVGNQSCPRAIAEGLKVAVVQETALDNDNCHWGRVNTWYGYRADVHLPDVDEARSSSMINAVASHTLLTQDRLDALVHFATETAHLEGEMAECGCFRGGSAKLIGMVCSTKKLHVFDTFKGLPSDEAIAGVHRAGDFAADRAEVEKFLGGMNVEIHEGVFPETAVGLENKKFSLVHLDMDLHEPTAAALDFFWPRMVPGGVIVLDDLDWHHTPGVNQALAERDLLKQVERTAAQQGALRKPRPSATEKIDITVIVVSWKRPRLLQETLASLKSKLSGLSHRIVVADNESSEETRAVIEAAGVDHYWRLPVNRGINWPVQMLLGPMLIDQPSEFVMVCDQDIHFGRDIRAYTDFLRENEDIAFAKGLDAPEHPSFTAREHGGEWWLLKKAERGGGVIMRTATLQAAFPLPTHKLIDFDWHLCSTGGLWAILPGTYAHTGYRDSTREGMVETPEKHILVGGRIVQNPTYIPPYRDGIPELEHPWPRKA